MIETAFLSARTTKLEEMAKKRSTGAIMALQILERKDDFLSSIQVVLTFVGVINSVFAGATLTAKLAPILAQIPSIEPYAPQIANILIVSFVTYITLVIGELVPKNIGLSNSESKAATFAPFVKAAMTFARPANWLLRISNRFVLKLLGVKELGENELSEEEMKLIIEKGAQAGVIEHEENEMIKSIFRFADRRAYTIMTSRRDVFWVDMHDSFSQIKEEILQNADYAKIPVCDESLDNVIGILSSKDYLSRVAIGEQHFDLQTLLQKPVFIPESTKAINILDMFRQSKTYVGIVVDEHGSSIGLITLHDLIENIFGDLPELDEPGEVPIVQREDGSWLIEGSTPVDELKDKIQIIEFEKEQDDFSTLAGFAMHNLKHIPHEGDSFVVGNYRFEIVDMDFNRIDKLLVTRLDKNEHNSSN